MTLNNSCTKSQLDKFKELAKEAECEPDEKKFDEQLKKIAKSKVLHASDCAMCNGPAIEAGPCDCGAEPKAQR